MGPEELRAYCKPSDEVKGLLREAIQQLGLSARAYDRLLKAACTISDLEREGDVGHVAEVRSRFVGGRAICGGRRQFPSHGAYHDSYLSLLAFAPWQQGS